MLNVRRLTAFLLFASALVTTLPALAQTLPSRPIRFLAGFAPGGTGDVVARIVANKLPETLGQQVIRREQGRRRRHARAGGRGAVAAPTATPM